MIETADKFWDIFVKMEKHVVEILCKFNGIEISNRERFIMCSIIVFAGGLTSV